MSPLAADRLDEIVQAAQAAHPVPATLDQADAALRRYLEHLARQSSRTVEEVWAEYRAGADAQEAKAAEHRTTQDIATSIVAAIRRDTSALI